MIVVRWSFGCRLAGLASVQELLFFLFLLSFSRTPRIERFHLTLLRWRELREMPYKHHQLPAILVFLLRAPGRHSGKPNAIVDDIVDLSVREVLGCGQAHVRRFR